MNNLNYAREYEEYLGQAFPNVLRFGALYATPNNGRFRYAGGKKVEIPVITVSGRTANDRDSVPTLARNYENSWDTKSLSHERKWSTLVHPADIDQTAGAAAIQNITKVFNEEQKFPEMDAYTISKIYADYTDEGETPTRVTLTSSNVLSTFDTLMDAMTEKNVPEHGRILYVTPAVMSLIRTAAGSGRIQTTSGIDRTVTSLDGVEVCVVPSALFMTAYDFTSGYEPEDYAEQISMLLIHPEAVITPVSYEYSCLDEPTAATGGKYVYYEESHEDVFILSNRIDGVAFVLPPATPGND